MQTGEPKNDDFLDLKGHWTGLPMNRLRTISLILTVVTLVAPMLLWKPLGLESAKAGIALGLVIATVVIWVSNQFSLVIGSLFLAVAGLLLGVLDLKQLSTAFGSSPFLIMFGMFTVSMGATRTNFTKRIAYLFLCKFGKSPSKILLAISLSTAIVSAFCSNLATTIVMSSICIGILTELGEEKGKSGLGKAMMLSIPIFSMVGGMALISGSPAMNTIGVSTLQVASRDAHTITYGQWAAIGIVCAIVISIPTWWIYKRMFGVNDRDAKQMPEGYFQRRLTELGPLSGPEYRWIFTVILMVGSMVAGIFPLPLASLLCGLITISPIIGTVEHEDAMQSLPMGVLMNVGLAPLVAYIFENYNIGLWLTGGFLGMLEGLPVIALMLAFGLVMAAVNNVFANATGGIIAVFVAAFTPVVMSMGLNPSIVLLPAIFMGACTVVLGVQVNMIITYDYGYWNMKDPIIPGCAISVLWTVIITIVAYFVGPLVGMSHYLA